MKVIFMGTPEFAVPSLEAILHSGHEVSAVFTQSPKPKGRKLEITKSPVQIMAEEHSIPVFIPSTLRSEEIFKIIDNIEADIIVVAAYGFILPKSILECKKYGAINLHPSRLPKFRGAAPLQHTIMFQEEASSICVIQMDIGMDTGDIILQQDFTLTERASLQWLHDFTANEGAKMIVQVLNELPNIAHRPQSEAGISIAPKLSKEDAEINWNLDAFDIDAKIRACITWPGSYFLSNLGRIKLIATTPIAQSHNDKPGTIVDKKNLIIACGKNYLKLERIIAPSGKKISVKDFLNGISGKEFSVIL